MMKTFKVLQLKTEGATHLVVRSVSGRKIFDLRIPGVVVTFAVAPDTEIKIKPRQKEEAFHG